MRKFSRQHSGKPYSSSFYTYKLFLVWGIGNELEGFESGDNPAIWAAVTDIAAMVKQLDSNHPTMNVTADIGGGRIEGVHKHCPAIVIHGINSYGGAQSRAEPYRAAGATKPYVLTEFGPALVVGDREEPLGRTLRADEHGKGGVLPGQL